MSLTHRACAISRDMVNVMGHYLRRWLWDAGPRCFQSGWFQLMVDSLGLRAGDGRSIWWRRGAFICFRWGAVTEGSGERKGERGGERGKEKEREVWARPRRSCANQHRSVASIISLLHCPDTRWRHLELLRSIFAESLAVQHTAAALFCSRLLTKFLQNW